MGIMFFQQFTGINAIVNNTVSIFEDAGSSVPSQYASIIVGAIQLIFTVFSGFMVYQIESERMCLSNYILTIELLKIRWIVSEDDSCSSVLVSLSPSL